METKNVRKTIRYVTKEKKFKSVKGLQRNFRKCIISFLRISRKKCKGKSWLLKGSFITPVKIFTLKMATPCIKC